MKKHTKRKLFSLAVIAICLSIVGTGTLAYFTDSTTAHNVITTGNIDIELIETKADGSIFTDVIGVMPGTEVSKIVEVKNVGDNAAWVRVNVDKEIKLRSGEAGDADAYLSINYNTGDAVDEWTKAGDYYYYNQALAPREKTSPLFEEVLFSANMGNEYQNSTAQVYVYAQATQVDNNGTGALDAAGWPTNTDAN
ncbi:MAG: hypothetical protein J6B76_05680 [Peptococcaceae bacterium]|nr:hypothetical protein [Peptococcaceae bacterium]